MAHVKKTKINGFDVTFEVNQDGKFTALIGPDQEEAQGETLAACEAHAAKITKKLKTAATKVVEVTLLGMGKVNNSWRGEEFGHVPGSLMHVTLRGIAERTRSLLLADDKGQKFQIETHRAKHRVARRLTADEQARYAMLTAVSRDAVAAVEEFEASVRIEPADIFADADGVK